MCYYVTMLLYYYITILLYYYIIIVCYIIYYMLFYFIRYHPLPAALFCEGRSPATRAAEGERPSPSKGVPRKAITNSYY